MPIHFVLHINKTPHIALNDANKSPILVRDPEHLIYVNDFFDDMRRKLTINNDNKQQQQRHREIQCFHKLFENSLNENVTLHKCDFIIIIFVRERLCLSVVFISSNSFFYTPGTPPLSLSVHSFSAFFYIYNFEMVISAYITAEDR